MRYVLKGVLPSLNKLQLRMYVSNGFYLSRIFPLGCGNRRAASDLCQATEINPIGVRLTIKSILLEINADVRFRYLKIQNDVFHENEN